MQTQATCRLVVAREQGSPCYRPPFSLGYEYVNCFGSALQQKLRLQHCPALLCVWDGVCTLPLKGSGCFAGHDSCQAVGHWLCEKAHDLVVQTMLADFSHCIKYQRVTLFQILRLIT
jgi:hypothetical protein